MNGMFKFGAARRGDGETLKLAKISIDVSWKSLNNNSILLGKCLGDGFSPFVGVGLFIIGDILCRRDSIWVERTSISTWFVFVDVDVVDDGEDEEDVVGNIGLPDTDLLTQIFLSILCTCEIRRRSCRRHETNRERRWWMKNRNKTLSDWSTSFTKIVAQWKAFERGKTFLFDSLTKQRSITEQELTSENPVILRFYYDIWFSLHG